MKPFHRIFTPIVLTVVLLTACGEAAPPPVSTGSGSSSTTTANTTTETVQTSPTAPAVEDTSAATTPPVETAPVDPTATMKDIAGLSPQKGGEFNKFFPDAKGSDFEVTFTQEKVGFAEVKLVKKDTEMAKISISDTVTNLTARKKFVDSKDTVGGFPMVTQGKKTTATLVGDRYQVKVMSRDVSFTEADRKAWLGKVNLKGLSAL